VLYIGHLVMLLDSKRLWWGEPRGCVEETAKNVYGIWWGNLLGTSTCKINNLVRR